MGLLFTNNRTTVVNKTERVIEHVTHKYDTPPEGLARIEDWRKEFLTEIIRIQSSPNALIKYQTFYDSSTLLFYVAFVLNGEDILISIQDRNLYNTFMEACQKPHGAADHEFWDIISRNISDAITEKLLSRYHVRDSIKQTIVTKEPSFRDDMDNPKDIEISEAFKMKEFDDEK